MMRGSGFRNGRSAAKSLGSFVPKLAGKAFEKYGFSIVMLLTEWRAIVGHELAEYSIPERLKWPRKVDAYTDTPAGEKGRPGATLVLRVDGPRAIDLQFQSGQIIERINAYFGYQAVTGLRFMQAPVEVRDRHAPALQARMPNVAATPAKSETGTDDDLAAALSRLENSVRSDTARREQHKTVS